LLGLPIFSIHGNHDDPAGDGLLSVLDVLADSGHINYFGKNDNIDSIKINPLLFLKGKTKLAVYGLGYIRDERLYRAFRDNKVWWIRPSNEEVIERDEVGDKIDGGALLTQKMEPRKGADIKPSLFEEEGEGDEEDEDIILKNSLNLFLYICCIYL
jgi:DNA repair exonuclease SbcCD nuclease subunit